MVDISLRDKNRIIVLNVVGKAPIRGRISSNNYFHTPLELLLSALGLCVGGKINDYCRLNDLNPAIFEKISVHLEDGKFFVTIKRPEDLEQEHITRIGSEVSFCTVAQELKKEVTVRWELNNTPTKELLKTVEQPCCGAM
jgi:uncharacterized OsmC-like protein